MLDRRAFLGAGIAGTAALTFSSVWSQQATPNFGPPTLPATGVKRMKLGAMEVIALNDGALRRPLGEEFVRNVPLEQVKSLLASQNLPTDYVDIPFTPFLVVTPAGRFLLDTGFADNGPPTTGKLAAQLAAAGFKPEDVDHVVISHYHGDHINGLRKKDGSLAFPKAKVHVPAPEHAFWFDDAKMNAAPPAAKGAFENARKVIGSLPADILVKYEPGQELAPGIKAEAAFGHTPGMSMVSVQSEGQKFMYVADLTNVPSLFARSPDWAVQFDMDAELARQTRRRVFDMLVKDKVTAGGYHFPFPALGTIETAGSGYQFKPVA
ncbi:MBL fold metallo-hydrolase [Hydrogenophaga sp. H7]|jgi:glyoxylase-like metal-dependent hydrolase (beta-lactamase superfamily II)|uniref:MBL fold metallo-hydrolase n=1 Tax=Hydrogenophaga sp. H7 TaxID=1882399 RepID=UPI0009A2D8BB|nr:MBL fold metallo-hydrolase [Hydrogenophaga sp. H7]OPF62737.1 MBL fold metallo-hydrolase [Hydrogenophaga sp. H7]